VDEVVWQELDRLVVTVSALVDGLDIVGAALGFALSSIIALQLRRAWR